MKAKHPYLVKLVVVTLVLLSLGVLVFILTWNDEFYDRIFWYALGFYVLIASGVAWYLTFLENKNINTDKAYLVISTFLRYFLCFEICMYGSAKWFGFQFGLYHADKDIPMAEASGILLTWYYFGYSRLMELFIGTIQIVSGALILSRRTQLIGALLLLPVMTNIVLVNIFYNITFGAAVNSILFLSICLYIIWINSDWVVEVIRRNYKSIKPAFGKTKMVKLLRSTFRIIAFVGPFAISTYVYLNFIPEKPAISGTWEMEKMIINGEPMTFPIDTLNPGRLYIDYVNSATLKIGDQWYWGDLSINESSGVFQLKYNSGKDSLDGKIVVQDSLMQFIGVRDSDSVIYDMKLVRK